MAELRTKEKKRRGRKHIDRWVVLLLPNTKALCGWRKNKKLKQQNK